MLFYINTILDLIDKYNSTISEEYQREIARLQMENKLLRDFLQSVERK